MQSAVILTSTLLLFFTLVVRVVLLPRQVASSYGRFQRFGPVVLLTVVLADVVFNLGILWGFIGPIVSGLLSAATGF